MEKSRQIELLKSIILEDDRKITEHIQEELDDLKDELHNPDKLGNKVAPHLEEKVNYIRDNFSTLFGQQITKSIKDQIKNSQDDVIDALYPIIGKLIIKFIKAEIEVLNERIDKTINNIFTFKFLWSRVKSEVTGEEEEIEIHTDLGNAEIQEIFITEKGSGLLISSFSRNDVADDDMVAGMLTAIKMFAEDAFRQKTQALEVIQYDEYNIYIQDFYSYYIAVCVSGVLTPKFKTNLQEQLVLFAEKFLKDPDNVKQQEIHLALKTEFDQA